MTRGKRQSRKHQATTSEQQPQQYQKVKLNRVWSFFLIRHTHTRHTQQTISPARQQLWTRTCDRMQMLDGKCCCSCCWCSVAVDDANASAVVFGEMQCLARRIKGAFNTQCEEQVNASVQLTSCTITANCT